MNGAREATGEVRETPLIVAIDGPAGGGKSTAARRLAERLGVPYLDTGAMYRAVAVAVLDHGADPEDREAVVKVVKSIDVSLVRREDGSFGVQLRGEDVEPRLRTPRVGEAASQVSTYPEVRERMVTLQRASARRLGGVLEGRDIGTKVFPDTPHKFFVTARPEIRAERRYLQHKEAGKDVDRDEVLKELKARDQRDENREESPLTLDDSYTRIDTSDLAPDQVVDRLEKAVREGR